MLMQNIFGRELRGQANYYNHNNTRLCAGCSLIKQPQIHDTQTANVSLWG